MIIFWLIFMDCYLDLNGKAKIGIAETPKKKQQVAETSQQLELLERIRNGCSNSRQVE